MNISVPKFCFILLALSLSIFACNPDSASADGAAALAKAAVEKAAKPMAEASGALAKKTEEVVKKSDELLEIYVSADEEAANNKEEALASIERKKEKAKAAERESSTSTESSSSASMAPATPVQKAPVSKPKKKVKETVVDEDAPLPPTKISFDKKVHEYGMIMQGDKVSHKFTFRNTGSEDLVISDVSASCGCTKPSYPFIPIAPGEKGYIGVNFDSTGKLGRQKPSVTVVSNAGTSKLHLEGFVDAERAGQPDANAPKVQIIDDSEMERLKEEALKSAPKPGSGGL